MSTLALEAALEGDSPIVAYLHSPESAGWIAFLWPTQVVEPFGKLWDVVVRSGPGARAEQNEFLVGARRSDTVRLIDGVNPDWTNDSRVVDAIGTRFFLSPPTTHSASTAEAIAWLEARGGEEWVAALSS